MVKFASGALFAALLCFATPARADSSTLLDPKVDLLRKAVQVRDKERGWRGAGGVGARARVRTVVMRTTTVKSKDDTKRSL
jgi:hypothetical protein